MPRKIVGVVNVSAAGSLLLLLAGCVTPATESGEEGARTASASESRPSATESSGSRESASRSASTSGSRESARSDAEKLQADLNDASRELATLRAAYARLKAEKGPAPAASSSGSSRSDAADDRLASSLKSYGALRQELSGILAELDKARSDAAAANAKLKEIASRTDDSRSTVAKLESDLRAEKRARAQAEQAVTKLQDQLRAVARALSSAGLSVDKLAETGAESSRR